MRSKGPKRNKRKTRLIAQCKCSNRQKEPVKSEKLDSGGKMSSAAKEGGGAFAASASTTAVTGASAAAPTSIVSSSSRPPQRQAARHVLDSAARQRRARKALESLERDNFHDDPHAGLVMSKKALSLFQVRTR